MRLILQGSALGHTASGQTQDLKGGLSESVACAPPPPLTMTLQQDFFIWPFGLEGLDCQHRRAHTTPHTPNHWSNQTKAGGFLAKSFSSGCFFGYLSCSWKVFLSQLPPFKKEISPKIQISNSSWEIRRCDNTGNNLLGCALQFSSSSPVLSRISVPILTNLWAFGLATLAQSSTSTVAC